MINAIPAILAGLVGWFGGLAAPVGLAKFFWREATNRPQRWWLHLIAGPVICVVELGCVQLIFWSAHDDGDGPPGLGLLIAPLFAVTAGTLAIYYLFLTTRIVMCSVTAMKLMRDKRGFE
ncbi:hypothetical protein KZX46_17560 [Polymorphobacter sp. PAMC 29334]|uniref:hypothetical protein n=1 Tax=Polymorphobacter sp. PAMC 29334 TaxID=2862331 RepID=UPI001C765917|nr:hypothetical protein [Polymorphobacter sp. PAMC 29334]QYE34548.1 hypothetical protein KZX46_17560 [Polymorphobacter sp. PAMC 29334]